MSTKSKKGIANKIAVTFLSISTSFLLSGASVAVPLVANAASLTEAQIQSILSLLQSFGADQGVVDNVNNSLRGLSSGGGTPPPSGGTSTNCNFTRSLTSGSRGADVKCLQQYLNGAGYQLVASGAGSPGNETEFFGPVTRSSVIKWQNANAAQVLTPVGLSAGTGFFGPSSRSHYNSLVSVVVPPPPSDGGTTPPPTTVPGSGLTVSSGTQPASSLAPKDATRVPFTRIRLTAAPDGDITVNSITVERTGLMNDSAISGVILLDPDGEQITNVEKSLNANHQAVLNDSFVVPAGQTREYTIAGNMASDLSSRVGEEGFLSVIAIDANAPLSGSLPITGAKLTANNSLSIGSITVAIGARDPQNNPTKEVGTTNYVFSAIKMTAGSAEDLTVEKVRWQQSGSVAKSDLDNVFGYDDRGNKYDVKVSSDGKYYTSNINQEVKKGENFELYIQGDIVSGSGRTVDFDIFRRTDLVIFGKTFKYHIKAPNGTDTAGTDDSAFHQNTNPWFDASQVEVGAGTLRVEKSNSVPAGNIAVGGSNQALGAFNFEAKGEAVNFTQLVLTVATTDSDSGAESATLTNVAIYDQNGSAIMGPKDLSGATTITYSDSVIVPVGVNTYTVRGKIASSGWENSDTVKVSLQTPATAITSVTGQTTGNSITPTPATNVIANTQTVKAGSLVVTPSSSLFAQNVIAGANNVELGRFNLDATNSGEDVRVTIVVIRADVTTMDLDELNNITLWDGTTVLTTGSNVLNPSGNTAGTDANITFTLDAPLIIAKGSNKIVSLKANISTATSANDKVKFDFSAGSPNWTVTGVASGASISETLQTTAGSQMTIKTGGGYEITEDSSAGQTEKWYPSGTTGVTVGAFRFRATTEAIALKDFQVQLTNTASSTSSDITALYLYDGAKLIAKKTFPAFTSNVENFSFNVNGAEGDGTINSPTNYLMIPSDDFKVITAKMDLVKIDANKGASGSLVAVDTGPGSNIRQKAVGQGSGTEFSPAVWSTAGTTVGTTTVAGVRYFRGVPKVESVALPSGTSLSSGVLYRFKITAQDGDVGIYKWTFQISTSGGSAMTLDQVKLTDDTLGQDVTNAITLVGTTSCVGLVQPSGHQTCNFDNNGNVVLPVVPDNTSFPKSSGAVRISAGTSHTFTLKANSVTLTSTTGETATTKLLGDAAYVVATTTVAGASSPGKKLTFNRKQVDTDLHDDFIWTDYQAEATTTATTANTNDWMNGFKVNGLETDLDAVTVSE